MSDLISVLNYVLLAASAVTCAMAAFKFMHMLQLEGYKAGAYLKWLFSRGMSFWVSCASIALISYALTFISMEAFVLTEPEIFVWVSLAARLAFAGLMYSLYLSGRNKAFRLTSRVKRLIVATLVLLLVGMFLPGVLQGERTTKWQYLGFNALTYLPGLILPIVTLLAHLIMLPAEEIIKRRYLNEAKAILSERDDLIRIGITGSYGKTSTKFILGTLLKEKFNVLVPPSSYNTPMGVTRVIREQLDDSHEVLIAEMGARRVGEIAELCELVRPDVGVLTAIGPQHLETFGNFANIIKTKFELIESLPTDTGAAIFNADNEAVNPLFDSSTAKYKLRYGIDSDEELFVRAKDIKTGPEGVEFTLVCGENEQRVKTKLLGKHNVLNIAGAAAAALHLGLTPEEIASGVEKLEPVEHRLQLIPGAVTVIDDAFNANPEGTKAALEVLSEFSGRKIVVTPGMVELGDQEDLHNGEFGRRLANVADEVILVGEKQTRAIYDALTGEGFDEERIHVVSNLSMATEKLSGMTRQGDVVLFENDLPANYIN